MVLEVNLERYSMRVLITGGCGFIGSALALRLASSGHHVAVFNNQPVAS